MWRGASRARRKPAQVFLVQAAALALLLGFLPRMDRIYPTAFNAHAGVVFNLALAIASPERSVRMATIDPGLNADRRDTRLVGLEGGRRLWRQFYRVFSMGWWPTACVTGLVLATPLPWRRRLLALAGGVLIVDALLLVRIGVMVLLNYAVSGPDPGAGWERAREVAEESFISWVPPLVFVLLAWASVASPATTIDLAAARRLVPRSRAGSGTSPPEGPGEGPARRVGEEAEEHTERRGDADERGRDRDLGGPRET